ncbi:MAG TPA: hypothetical protein VK611_10505 [Acidimicrobiales bacterium]|nr:hypothetical protein [Acidimicrobiales bacterium]
MTLLGIHEGFSWVVVLSNAAVGLWALAAHYREDLRKPALWWATLAAELTVFVQVFLGVGVMRADDVEVDDLHALYGFSGIVAVGIIYSYRQQLAEKKYLLYGLGGLFIMGLGIRNMFIGGART